MDLKTRRRTTSVGGPCLPQLCPTPAAPRPTHPCLNRPPPARARQVLCMPIYGQPAAEGEAPPILGVAQCLNKRDGKSFTAQDEQMMAALCNLFSACFCPWRRLALAAYR